MWQMSPYALDLPLSASTVHEVVRYRPAEETFPSEVGSVTELEVRFRGGKPYASGNWKKGGNKKH